MDANQFFINEVSPTKELRNTTLWKGQKNILNNKEDTIMSMKGTVRGVKNRVRAGIATFLQDGNKRVNFWKKISFKVFWYFLELLICWAGGVCDIPDKPGDSEEYSREMHYGQEDTEEHADQVHGLIQQF